MKKRAFLISQTIVTLALTAVVIVFVLLLLTGQFKIFSRGINDCEAKGGECVPKETGCEYGPSFLPGCSKEKVCCMKTDKMGGE